MQDHPNDDPTHHDLLADAMFHHQGLPATSLPSQEGARRYPYEHQQRMNCITFRLH
jgi:hypothetical protein